MRGLQPGDRFLERLSFEVTRICHVARLLVAEGHEAVDGDVSAA